MPFYQSGEGKDSSELREIIASLYPAHLNHTYIITISTKVMIPASRFHIIIFARIPSFVSAQHGTPPLDLLLLHAHAPSLPPLPPRLHAHLPPLRLPPTVLPRPRELTPPPTRQINLRGQAPLTPAPLQALRAPALLPARVGGGGCWRNSIFGGKPLAGEEEGGFGQDAHEDGAEGGEAGGDDVV